MKRSRKQRSSSQRKKTLIPRAVTTQHHRRGAGTKPAAGYRQRGGDLGHSEAFNAPEIWHEPCGSNQLRFVVEEAGEGFLHPANADEIQERIELLPARFQEGLENIHLRQMTRKRALFPCYGMQWASTVYLYPIEDSLVETYSRPPKPQQIIEAKMYGGVWREEAGAWHLEWTEETIRDFYLNNVLIHEIGHIVDERNTSYDDRERFANWFAIEYGYRTSRGKR